MVQDQVRRGEFELLLTDSQESSISSFKSKCSNSHSHALELYTSIGPFQQQAILPGCAILFKPSHSGMSANVDRGFWYRTPQSFLANEMQSESSSF